MLCSLPTCYQTNLTLKNKKMKKNLFSVFTIITICITISLGFWQIKRYFEKTSANEVLHNSFKNPKKDFFGIGIKKEFETVLFKGRFINHKQLLIGPKKFQKKIGFFVFNILKTRDRNVIVHRGFIKEKDLHSIERIGLTKEVLVKLISRKESKKRWFLPKNTLLQNKNGFESLQHIYLNDIANFFDIDYNDKYYYSALEQSNKIKPIIDENYEFWNPHLEYTGFWFIMAFVLLVMLIIYRKKQ